MGYNIEDVESESVSGGPDNWVYVIDLNDPAQTTASGDFDAVSAGGGEAPTGYTFSALSDPSFGSLTEQNTVTGEFTFTVDATAVINSGSDQSVTFTVVGGDGFFSDSDTVTINIIICVARGTLIETPSGARPVETLRVGDAVNTLDGPPKDIRWIGRKHLTAEELDAAPWLRPVRVKQAAFGEGLPQRDLLVSPQHRICLTDWRAQMMFGAEEVLAPAKGLVDGTRVHVDTTVSEVEYFHLLFDAHEVIFTDGLPTESFHPGLHSLNSLERAARDELLALFPNLDQASGLSAPARMPLKPWEASLLVGDTAVGPAR